MKPLRILYVAYPLLPVTPESCGGAEQVLLATETEMFRRGHATSVAAPSASTVAGELIETVTPCEELDRFDEINSAHAEKVVELVLAREREERPFDLVHDHSGIWWQHADKVRVPVLATLHLPRAFYLDRTFQSAANVTFACVSSSQQTAFKDLIGDATIVENGIDLRRFVPGPHKDDFLLWMGRICEEKGPHIAIEVARRSRARLVLAGSVYPFSYHQDYFQREIADGLGEAIELRKSPRATEKVELLQSARAVLIPSLVDETSSLIAMEALACGTPVIAFNRGALRDLIQNGVTGRLVHSIEEMVQAVREISGIHPKSCREWAESHCSLQQMCDGYVRLYGEIASRAAPAGAAA